MRKNWPIRLNLESPWHYHFSVAPIFLSMQIHDGSRTRSVEAPSHRTLPHPSETDFRTVAKTLTPYVTTERLVRQKDFKHGILDNLSRKRIELAARWRVRSVQPEVGQENGKEQEN
ncbi:hypothetical protein Rcae01_00950 [Novipirellula caenicola]|uniref:Uncharacterized protein n=1 Tax=Novipirellula caenicola TaxID=1536901 RepID=A0ABP9VMJ6_9BACT